MGKITLGPYKSLFITFLIGVTAFSVFKYTASLKETYDLTSTVKKLKAEVAFLESEKQTLAQELNDEKTAKERLSAETLTLQDNLKISEEKLVSLRQNYTILRKELELVKIKVQDLKEENSVLAKEKADLEAQISQVVEEKEKLNTKLGSVVELKKAIKEVKEKIYSTRRKVKEESRQDVAVDGNHGFLMKNGKSTFPPRIRIEVTTTAPPKSTPKSSRKPFK